GQQEGVGLLDDGAAVIEVGIPAGHDFVSRGSDLLQDVAAQEQDTGAKVAGKGDGAAIGGGNLRPGIRGVQVLELAGIVGLLRQVDERSGSQEAGNELHVERNNVGSAAAGGEFGDQAIVVVAVLTADHLDDDVGVL